MIHRKIIEAQKIIEGENADLFQDLMQNIDSKIIHVFETIEIGENGFDLQKEGIKAPTATWTYLVNDQPFEGQLGVLLARWGNTEQFVKFSNKFII